MDSDPAQVVGPGPGCIVATRDEEMRPEIARGWAPEVNEEAAIATVCIGAERDSKMGSNLLSNGAIALTMTHPTTYRGIQAKGRVSDVGEPTAEQLERVQAHLAAFAAQVELLGLGRELTRRLLVPDLMAVTFAVHELYDQTPGPRAGARL
jgi:Pyridoxamine 5'-phosphate oxidase